MPGETTNQIVVECTVCEVTVELSRAESTFAVAFRAFVDAHAHGGGNHYAITVSLKQ